MTMATFAEPFLSAYVFRCKGAIFVNCCKVDALLWSFLAKSSDWTDTYGLTVFVVEMREPNSDPRTRTVWDVREYMYRLHTT